MKVVQRPILVYGSFLGATLATSLALTESFASKNLPTRIAGLVAKNGVYDWTEVATSPRLRISRMVMRREKPAMLKHCFD